jgi:protein-S-isoprenylcysteine O-methyltransferase Ste14
MKNIVLNYSTLLVAIIGIPCFVSFILYSVPIDSYVITGIGLITISFILLITARIQLGNSFSITAQANHLVTSGVYSKLRHPIYTFGQMLILGIALCLKSPIFFLFWLVLFFVQYSRAKAEEKVLEVKFGDAYREYKARTWF